MSLVRSCPSRNLDGVYRIGTLGVGLRFEDPGSPARLQQEKTEAVAQDSAVQEKTQRFGDAARSLAADSGRAEA